MDLIHLHSGNCRVEQLTGRLYQRGESSDHNAAVGQGYQWIHADTAIQRAGESLRYLDTCSPCGHVGPFWWGEAEHRPQDDNDRRCAESRLHYTRGVDVLESCRR